jgi:hypothetical protein
MVLVIFSSCMPSHTLCGMEKRARNDTGASGLARIREGRTRLFAAGGYAEGVRNARCEIRGILHIGDRWLRMIAKTRPGGTDPIGRVSVVGSLYSSELIQRVRDTTAESVGAYLSRHILSIQSVLAKW